MKKPCKTYMLGEVPGSPCTKCDRAETDHGFYGERHAEVAWRAEDIKTLRPRWSLEKCETWLEANGGDVQDRTTELGWEVLEDLIS